MAMGIPLALPGKAARALKTIDLAVAIEVGGVISEAGGAFGVVGRNLLVGLMSKNLFPNRYLIRH